MSTPTPPYPYPLAAMTHEFAIPPAATVAMRPAPRKAVIGGSLSVAFGIA